MPKRRLEHLDLTAPRAVSEVLELSLRLLAYYPVLVMTLSAIVIVPYNLIVVAVGHSYVLTAKHTSVMTQFELELVS